MTTAIDWPARLLYLLRIPLVGLLVLSGSLYYVNAVGLTFLVTTLSNPLQSLPLGLMNIANLLLVYLCFAYFVERRPVSELALSGGARELALGLLLGFGLMTVCVLIAMAFGSYRIEGLNSWHNLMPSGVALSLPFFEELLFRGAVFGILERLFGSWMALVLSSLVFGGVHLANADESLVGIAAIALVYGPMLTAPLLLTRRLWMSIGLHAAWNYTMGKVFSVSVSGVATAGLFQSTFTGPDLLTGGSAGMEGSLIGILVGATASVLMLVIAVRRGHLLPAPGKQPPRAD